MTSSNGGALTRRAGETVLRVTLRAVLILGFLILLFWVAITQFAYWWADYDFKESALIGDTFGAVNSLFSGLALAGVIIAILLQRQELQLQRDELQLTREELTRTAIAQEGSHKALSRQADSLLLAAYLNAINSLRESGEQTGDSHVAVSGEFRPTLRAILTKLEEQMPDIVARTAGDGGRHAVDERCTQVVNRIKDRVARLKLALSSFDHKPTSVEVVKEKLRFLHEAIEGAVAITDDDVKGRLQLQPLECWVVDIRRCLAYEYDVPPETHLTDNSRNFYARAQGIMHNVEGWAQSRR